MSYQVVFTDHTFNDLSIERQILGEVDATVIDGETSDTSIRDLVTTADGLIVMYHEIDAGLIQSMENCKIISRTGIGFDNVDIETATTNGIAVTNVPDYCIPEVSDHVIALLLALERKLVTYNASVSTGNWDVSVSRPMRRLETQTLGLVAFGNIAQAVCQKARVFGMDVIAHDPYLDDDTIRAGDAEPIEDLTEVLTRSDAVSVHTPLTPETEGMIDADAFREMKDSAFILNAARGGIIDESALGEALETNQIAGAGIDVLAEEPPDETHPLVGHPNVILTPHAAWNSTESVLELREKAARNVKMVLDGQEPPYLLNDVTI